MFSNHNNVIGNNSSFRITWPPLPRSCILPWPPLPRSCILPSLLTSLQLSSLWALPYELSFWKTVIFVFFACYFSRWLSKINIPIWNYLKIHVRNLSGLAPLSILITEVSVSNYLLFIEFVLRSLIMQAISSHWDFVVGFRWTLFEVHSLNYQIVRPFVKFSDLEMPHSWPELTHAASLDRLAAVPGSLPYWLSWKWRISLLTLWFGWHPRF